MNVYFFSLWSFLSVTISLYIDECVCVPSLSSDRLAISLSAWIVSVGGHWIGNYHTINDAIFIILPTSSASAPFSPSLPPIPPINGQSLRFSTNCMTYRFSLIYGQSCLWAGCQYRLLPHYPPDCSRFTSTKHRFICVCVTYCRSWSEQQHTCN